MKLTLIQLMNRAAEGKRLPHKIKFYGTEYVLEKCGDILDYVRADHDEEEDQYPVFSIAAKSDLNKVVYDGRDLDHLARTYLIGVEVEGDELDPSDITAGCICRVPRATYKEILSRYGIAEIEMEEE